MAGTAEARSPYELLSEVEHAREILILSYTTSLEFFERFVLADARALGALVTVVSDASMVRSDPLGVRHAGINYLDARAVCPEGAAFHPKLLVIVGDRQARVAIGSGNLTMAGWFGNAETWVVLRADEEGGPETIRDVASFLRQMTASPITLSDGAAEALVRVAEGLDALPAYDPGPRLLHSLSRPILAQLQRPEAQIAELAIHSPFHDGRVEGVQGLVDALEPETWRVMITPQTRVDGHLLSELAARLNGTVAWIADRAEVDGSSVPDHRYRHGKLAQWRVADGRAWALTGSPNITRPAVLQRVGDGGNCELAVLSVIQQDLVPAEGEPPSGGIEILEPPSFDSGDGAPILLCAVAGPSGVLVRLSGRLELDGAFERHDNVDDRWVAVLPVRAGEGAYVLAHANAPTGRALRLRTNDGATSNEVFVADPERLRHRQHQAVGKVRLSMEEVIRVGLLPELLDDIEQLRPHLLRVGVLLRPQAPLQGQGGDDGSEPPLARRAPDQTLDEFIEACEPVLGMKVLEYALVLPSLPSVDAYLDDDVGTLDTDSDEMSPLLEDEAVEPGKECASEFLAPPTVSDEIRALGERERARLRRYIERLVDTSSDYPLVVRILALRLLLDAIGAGELWDEDAWPLLLARAVAVLAAPDGASQAEVVSQAASWAAVGLAILRLDVGLAVMDEQQLRFSATAAAVRALLPHRDPDAIEAIAARIKVPVLGASGARAAEEAAHEVLHPLRGTERAAELLWEEDGHRARVVGDATIVIETPLPPEPRPMLVRALHYADEPGPIFARAETVTGTPLLAAWCAPWLAIERTNQQGVSYGFAWHLGVSQPLPAVSMGEQLPHTDVGWSAGEQRPEEVADLLDIGDEDWSGEDGL